MKNYQWVKDEIEKLLTVKVICSSRSSWSAPIMVVLKGDRGIHFVINYRALNKVTKKFAWPMPKVEDIFSKLNGAKYFSTLDLRPGYHHISLDKSSIPKNSLQSTLWKIWVCQGFFQISTSFGIFSTINDQNLEGFWFCNCLPRWHHHLQPNSWRTPVTHQKGFWET